MATIADDTRPNLLRLFNRPRPLVAMLHVPALPGTPRAALSPDAIVRHVCTEARTLADAGFDGLIIENMHDLPYLRGRVDAEIVALLTAVTAAVTAEVSVPLGVQVLAGANREALAVAHAGGAAFIRAENFVFAHVADEGLMDEAAAGPLLRYRRRIGAVNIALLADIKKKHASHAITADVALVETARAAAFAGADGVIITGVATGTPAAPAEVAEVASAVDLPVWVGSGVTPANLPGLWPHAAGFIVGSCLKQGGRWSAPLDPQRIADLRAAAAALR